MPGRGVPQQRGGLPTRFAKTGIYPWSEKGVLNWIATAAMASERSQGCHFNILRRALIFGRYTILDAIRVPERYSMTNPMPEMSMMYIRL